MSSDRDQLAAAMGRIALTALLFTSLAGCATRHLNPHFGRALEETLAAQEVSRIPQLQNNGPSVTDGVRAAAAISRYQSGQVIKPLNQATNSIGGAGTVQ